MVKAASSPTLKLPAGVPQPLAFYLFALLGALLVACEQKPSSDGGKTATRASVTPSATPAPTGVLSPEAVDEVTNPDGREVYSGPVGTVRGVIRVTGDQPPDLTDLIKKIPVGKCFEAHKRYSKLFREGSGRTLADVLVAVTEYQGHLAPRTEPYRVIAKDCAYDTRTVALSYGQSIEVLNQGRETHTPQLVGSNAQALLVALPGGAPIRLTAPKVGLYQLIDHSHEYIFADVFVVTYPSTAVTGLDGKFEIAGLPVGKAKLSAMLPITRQTVDREIEIRPDAVTTVELELPFNARDFEQRSKPKPSATPSGSFPSKPSPTAGR